MNEDRKKPGWAFWTTVALVAVLVGYPLSYGPVTRLWATILPAWTGDAIRAIYRPLDWCASRSEATAKALRQYADWWNPEILVEPD